MFHFIALCECLLALFALLEDLCEGLQVGFNIGVLIVGPRYSLKHNHRLALVIFLFGQAMLGMQLTRKTMIKEGQVNDPLLVFRRMVLENLLTCLTVYIISRKSDVLMR